MADFITCPFTVVVDTREQAPYDFGGLHVVVDRQREGRRIRECVHLHVPTVRAGLETGDYSILGMEDRVCVERKSLNDALSTFTSGRERFQRELERMTQLQSSSVVLEFEWSNLLRLPNSDVDPSSVDGSIMAWTQRFKIPFFHRPGRAHSQRFVLLWLRRFWNDRAKGGENEESEAPPLRLVPQTGPYRPC